MLKYCVYIVLLGLRNENIYWYFKICLMLCIILLMFVMQCIKVTLAWIASTNI